MAKQTEKRKAESEKAKTAALNGSEPKALEIRILAKRPTGSDVSTAWLELDPRFKATSTNNNEAAAHNLAVRHFLGSAWKAQIPDSELKKVSVEHISPGVFIGRYQS